MTSSAARYFSSIKDENSPPLGELKLTRVVALANKLRDRLGISQQWVEAHYDEASRRFPRMDREQSPWAEFTYCQAVLQAWVHGSKKVNPDKRRQRTAEEWEKVLRFFDKEFGITNFDSVYRLKSLGFSKLQRVIRGATDPTVYLADQRDVATHTTDILFFDLCLEELLEKESNIYQRFFSEKFRNLKAEVTLFHDFDENPFGESNSRVATQRFANGNDQEPSINPHYTIGAAYLRLLADELDLADDQNVQDYINNVALPAMEAMDKYPHTKSDLRNVLANWGIENKKGFLDDFEIKNNKTILDKLVIEPEYGLIASYIKLLDRIVGSLEKRDPITGFYIPAAKDIHQLPTRDAEVFLGFAMNDKKGNPRHLGNYLWTIFGEKANRNYNLYQDSSLPNTLPLGSVRNSIPKEYKTKVIKIFNQWLGLVEDNNFIKKDQIIGLCSLIDDIHLGIVKRQQALDKQRQLHHNGLGALGRLLDVGGNIGAPILQAGAGGILAGVAANALPAVVANPAYSAAAFGSLLAQWPMLQVGLHNRLPLACSAVLINTAILTAMTHGGQQATDALLPYLIGVNATFSASYYGNRAGRPRDNSTKMDTNPMTAVPRLGKNLLIEGGRSINRIFKSIKHLPRDLHRSSRDLRDSLNGGDLEEGSLQRTVESLHSSARINMLVQFVPVAAIGLLRSHDPAHQFAFWLLSTIPTKARIIDGIKSGNPGWKASGILGTGAGALLASAEILENANPAVATILRTSGIAALYASFAAFSAGTNSAR